jgi:anaerobic selenocysteine-containing dehydrogenase
MQQRATPAWHKTACILCSVNCGLEVQTDGARIVRARGDDAHPLSRGYLCEKSQRMDYYQNGPDRIDTPMKRRADGSYEAISWDQAIAEIAARLSQVRDTHGGDKILFYGGGSQGDHLGGLYADATMKALGVKYRSNALAQEKTGEAWVQGKMFGAGVHGDFEHCEVAVFVGKNPWQSHGMARARVHLRAIELDPKRSIIVIDPRLSETAAMADFHLAIRPGTDAWCLAALAAVIVQEGLVARDWVARHTEGYAAIEPILARVPIDTYATVCDVDADLLRRAARRIAQAESVSMIEDLGLQMSPHSTLSSYLQRLTWLLTGHYARRGTNNAFVPLLSLAKASKGQTVAGEAARVPAGARVTPVTGSKIIMGLVPCNVIPEEILTDHPGRFRAMFIESANPVHSLADSPRMRAALRALELSVVIDVAMTETARQADYVLPATSQFEKASATFFGIEFPDNAFQVRAPLFAPRPGTLTEAEIHARLLEALGALEPRDWQPLARAARLGRAAFTARVLWAMARNPRVARYTTVALYRALGPKLPPGYAAAAGLWAICQLYVRGNRAAAARAGYGGIALAAANRLFDDLIAKPSGVIFARSEHEDSWQAVKHPGGRIQLAIAELLPLLENLGTSGPATDPDYPWVLSAGERRSESSNTPIRDTGWHRKGVYGALRMHPEDARKLGVADGGQVRITTRRGSAQAPVETSPTMRRGHVALPNGQGLDVPATDGRRARRGVALNELTDGASRDPIAGTPWHKHVPARLEAIAELGEQVPIPALAQAVA